MPGDPSGLSSFHLRPEHIEDVLEVVASERASAPLRHLQRNAVGSELVAETKVQTIAWVVISSSIPERELTSSILVVLRTDGALKERGLAGSGTRFRRCQALIARLVTLMFVELLTQPRMSLV
jgi:hypothetical protein